jgi:hypothetical protein
MRVDVAIIFVGLIVQVNQPWSLDNTAVLPNVDDHTAEMVIQLNDLAVPQEVLQVGGQAANNNTVVVPLKGVDVRVRGTKGMFNRRTREYRESVPSLKRVGQCRTLQEQVRNREQSEALAGAGFVDIRGGRMVPHSFAPARMSFQGTDFQNRCAACSVMYEASIRGETALLEFRITPEQHAGKAPPYEVHLKKGAELLVRNAPNKYVPPHFEHTYKVFQDCGKKQAPGATLPCRKPNCTKEMFDWDGNGRPAHLSSDCIIDDA